MLVGPRLTPWLVVVGGYNGKSCIPVHILGSMPISSEPNGELKWQRTSWRTQERGGEQPNYFAWEMNIS